MSQNDNVFKTEGDNAEDLALNADAEPIIKIDIEKTSELCRGLIEELNTENFDGTQWIVSFEGYVKNYRILYSVVSAEMFNMGDQNIGNVLTNITTLISDQNMSSETSFMLIKLYDHINLANQQLNLISGIKISNGATIKSEIEASTQKTSDAINKNFKEDINKQTKKIKSVEKNYIAILGIFAAIIVAFTGNMAFSTSVLANMHLNNTYRTIIVSILISQGFIHLVHLLISGIYRVYKEKDYPYPKWMKTANIFTFALLSLTALIYVFENQQFAEWYETIAALEAKTILIALLGVVTVTLIVFLCSCVKSRRIIFIHKVIFVENCLNGKTEFLNLGETLFRGIRALFPHSNDQAILNEIINTAQTNKKNIIFHINIGEIKKTIKTAWCLIKINKKIDEYIKFNVANKKQFEKEELKYNFEYSKYKWKTVKFDFYSYIIEKIKFDN